MKVAYRKLYDFDEKNLYTLENQTLDILKSLNGQIEFGDIGIPENVYCVTVSASFGTSGTELTATHTLGRTAKGIIVIRKDGAGDVYFSKAPTSADASGNANVFLKSTTSSLSAVMLVIQGWIKMANGCDYDFSSYGVDTGYQDYGSQSSGCTSDFSNLGLDTGYQDYGDTTSTTNP